MAKSIPDLRGIVIYDNDDSIPAGRGIVIQDDAAVVSIATSEAWHRIETGMVALEGAGMGGRIIE